MLSLWVECSWGCVEPAAVSCTKRCSSRGQRCRICSSVAGSFIGDIRAYDVVFCLDGNSCSSAYVAHALGVAAVWELFGSRYWLLKALWVVAQNRLLLQQLQQRAYLCTTTLAAFGHLSSGSGMLLGQWRIRTLFHACLCVLQCCLFQAPASQEAFVLLCTLLCERLFLGIAVIAVYSMSSRCRCG